LATELGISELTTFHGHLASRAAIDGILDGAHVFAMTSASEGMPRAMIEAMARGVPAVGADAAGIAELLAPDQRFPPGDSRSLGVMLEELSRDPARLAALSNASVETARGYIDDILSSRRVQLLEWLRGATAPYRTT
jgi:glycosyltransferase involved in cell wall biosynthesis